MAEDKKTDAGFYTKLESKVMQLRLQMECYLNHAPRHEREALCRRIRDREDEVYEGIIECRKRYYNKTSLTKLDIAHEKLRGLIFLFFKSGYFDYRKHQKAGDPAEELRRFTNINVQVNEIGAMIGGIIKSVRAEMNSN